MTLRNKKKKYHYDYKTNSIVRFSKLIFFIFYFILYINEIINNNYLFILMFNCPWLCVLIMIKIFLFYIDLNNCSFKLLIIQNIKKFMLYELFNF